MAGGSQALAIPRLRGPRVERCALRLRVEETLEPFLFIVAPAGFGKTSLLADWARTTPHEVLWITCIPPDHEPAFFWRRLLDALADRWPTASQAVAHSVVLQGAGPSRRAGSRP